MKVILLYIGLNILSFNVLAEKRAKLDNQTKNQIIATLKANEKLHQSFFDYKKETVDKAAKGLLTTINKIENNEISKLLVFAKKKLMEITKDNERELNNTNYHIVSSAMIYIVNKYDIGKDYNAYSCPMVKKKWIQNSKKKDEVLNPYAANMPNCGTKDTNY